MGNEKRKEGKERRRGKKTTETNVEEGGEEGKIGRAREGQGEEGRTSLEKA